MKELRKILSTRDFIEKYGRAFLYPEKLYRIVIRAESTNKLPVYMRAFWASLPKKETIFFVEKEMKILVEKEFEEKLKRLFPVLRTKKPFEVKIIGPEKGEEPKIKITFGDKTIDSLDTHSFREIKIIEKIRDWLEANLDI